MNRPSWSRGGAVRTAGAAVLTVVMAVALAVGATACGITADEAPRRIPDNAVPELLRGTTDTTVPATETTSPPP